MNRTTAAVLIALAFTVGNIAAPSAQSLKQLRSTPQPHTLSPQAPSGAQNLQAKPFPANCVQGFQKYNEDKTNIAGVPVVSRFDCRTAWIECPNFPAFAETWLDYEIDTQGAGDSKRVRFKYTCMGYNPEG